MIKNVLIPEKINNYYLFKKRVVGFSFDASTVYATKIYLNGSKIKVEQVFSESIQDNEFLSYEEKVAHIVKDILKRAGRYDEVHTAMPSSNIIFKTLRLPFLNYEKIKMVINYEVEPLLPFELDDAMIDFVIVGQSQEDNSSEVLVAAVKKSFVAEHISFFEQAGVMPQKISVDLFSLYSLYKKIPDYNSLQGGIALIDIGSTSSRVAYIYNGQLKAVRVLPQGIDNFIADIAKLSSYSFEDTYKIITTFGLTKTDDKAYYEATTKILKDFWSKVQFTLTSFLSEDDEQGIVKIIFAGQANRIDGFDKFIANQSNESCEYFQIMSLFADKQISVKKNVNISAAHVTSLGVALPSTVTQFFNFMPLHMMAERDVSILTRQVFMAIIFFVIVFASLLTHSFLQVGKLQRELKESQQDVVTVLKERFVVPEDENDFDDVVESARRSVTKEENVWAPFSAQSHFLKYLLELHSLDLEDLGFQLEKVSITDKEMILKARVKDYSSVAKLEKELRRSKLFKYEGSEQKTDFTMKIALNRGG